MRWVKRLAIGFVCLVALIFFTSWLILSSEMLAGLRGKLTAQYLSTKIGHTVRIDGGVSVELGPVLHVTTDGLVLPSTSMPNVTLAKIADLAFDVALVTLWRGAPDPKNLTARGAEINFSVDQDGVTSWAKSGKAKRKRAKSRSPITFLSRHTLQFSESRLIYQDARNGLDMDLSFASLTLEQANDTTPMSLEGQGTLNGENVVLTGSFPAEQPFNATATFDDMKLSFQQIAETGSDPVGQSIALTADIAELGQLLDVLKLNRVLSGTGSISAVLKIDDDTRQLNDLKINVALGTGQSLALTGNLGVLGDPSDVSVDTTIDLYTEQNMPPPTRSRRDLKLTRVEMSLAAQPGGVPQRHMVISTNGFVLDTRGEGPPPISVSRILRTSDGKLWLGGVRLLIGPQGAPFLDVTGQIKNALQLEEVSFETKLSFPTAGLLAPELFQTSDVLGLVEGGFRLVGSAEGLALSDLKATSQDTDLWHLDVGGSVGNALNLSDVALDISADISSGEAILTALNLRPVKTGPVKLSAELSSEGTEWKSSATVSVDESQLAINSELDFGTVRPSMKGNIESNLIQIETLRKIISAVTELDKLSDTKKQTDSDKGAQKDASDDEGETDGTQNDGPIRNVTLRPMGQSILLSDADLDIDINLKEIKGVKGSTSLKTKLEMKDKKMQLGPAEFEYDTIHFDVTASMDLEKDPNNVRFSGSTGGWGLEEILHELRFKKGARGNLGANFDISGHRTSGRDFLATMSGDATISMRNGSIDSQLLDIAGLGVLPWLFSKDHGHVAPVICVRAPLAISNGRIDSKNTVVETDQVQIVVSGDVDLKHKTLDISGQPRRIGKPLSRSPWPFTAKGPLAKPKIKVKDGPRRMRRSDGASTMPKRRKICVPDILQLR
ncbi:MAG: AsmA family protein [Paracoccaceae bacterium]